MLRTDARSLLVDLLAPPEPGDRLIHAVGTTFTLQLDALLRVPLAVVGAEWRSGLDPLGVMEAVRRSASRIDLFCQAGMVAVPDPPSALLAFLEPMVHPVHRPRGDRLFHPKVWLARFKGHDGATRFRFLCGSRNQTADRAWDTVVGLDGEIGSRIDARNAPLAEFIASLPARATHPLDAARAEAVAATADAVRRAQWAPIPEAGVDSQGIHFHWLDVDRPFRGDLSGARRRLVISPFLNADGLARLCPDRETTLVTRPETLADLDPEARARLVECGVECLELDDAAAIPDEDADDLRTRWSLRGLHAKVFLLERGNDVRLFIGSANATGPAWDGNTEFLVELEGPRRRIGVSAVLGEGEGSFRSILRSCEPEESEQTGATLEDQLQRAIVDLAARALTATAIPAREQWCLALTSSEALHRTLPGDAKVSLRPLTTHNAQEIAPGALVDESWTDLNPEQITPFFALRLTANEAGRPVVVETIVLAALEGGPEDRLDRVIAAHVGDPAAFLRFLMALLQLGEGGTPELPGIGAGGGAFRRMFGANAEGVLESLVQALADQPESIDEVARLVERLEATEAGRRVLPDGWSELWPRILAVHGATRTKAGAR